MNQVAEKSMTGRLALSAVDIGTRASMMVSNDMSLGRLSLGLGHNESERIPTRSAASLVQQFSDEEAAGGHFDYMFWTAGDGQPLLEPSEEKAVHDYVQRLADYDIPTHIAREFAGKFDLDKSLVEKATEYYLAWRKAPEKEENGSELATHKIEGEPVVLQHIANMCEARIHEYIELKRQAKGDDVADVMDDVIQTWAMRKMTDSEDYQTYRSVIIACELNLQPDACAQRNRAKTPGTERILVYQAARNQGVGANDAEAEWKDWPEKRDLAELTVVAPELGLSRYGSLEEFIVQTFEIFDDKRDGKFTDDKLKSIATAIYPDKSAHDIEIFMPEFKKTIEKYTHEEVVDYREVAKGLSDGTDTKFQVKGPPEQTTPTFQASGGMTAELQKVLGFQGGGSYDAKDFFRKFFIRAFYVWTGSIDDAPISPKPELGSLLSHNQFMELMKSPRAVEEFTRSKPWNALKMEVHQYRINEFLSKPPPQGATGVSLDRTGRQSKHNPWSGSHLDIHFLSPEDESNVHKKFVSEVQGYYTERHNSEPHKAITSKEAEAAQKTDPQTNKPYDLSRHSYHESIKQFREDTEDNIKAKLAALHNSMNALNIDGEIDTEDVAAKARSAYDSYFAKLASVNPGHMSDVVLSARRANKANHYANEALTHYLDRLIRTANLSHRVYNRGGLDHLMAHAQTIGQLQEGHMAPGRAIKIYFPIAPELKFEDGSSTLDEDGKAYVTKGLASEIQDKLEKYRGMHFTICVHVATQISSHNVHDDTGESNAEHLAALIAQAKAEAHAIPEYQKAPEGEKEDCDKFWEKELEPAMKAGALRLENKTLPQSDTAKAVVLAMGAAIQKKLPQAQQFAEPLSFNPEAKPLHMAMINMLDGRQDSVITALKAGFDNGMEQQITFPQAQNGVMRHFDTQSDETANMETGIVMVIAEDRMHKEEHIFDAEFIKSNIYKLINRLERPRESDFQSGEVAYTKVDENKITPTGGAGPFAKDDYVYFKDNGDQAVYREVTDKEDEVITLRGGIPANTKPSIRAVRVKDMLDDVYDNDDEGKQEFIEKILNGNMHAAPAALEATANDLARDKSKRDLKKFKGGADDEGKMKAGSITKKCDISDFTAFRNFGTKTLEEGQTNLYNGLYAMGEPQVVYDPRTVTGKREHITPSKMAKLPALHEALKAAGMDGVNTALAANLMNAQKEVMKIVMDDNGTHHFYVKDQKTGKMEVMSATAHRAGMNIEAIRNKSTVKAKTGTKAAEFMGTDEGHVVGEPVHQRSVTTDVKQYIPLDPEKNQPKLVVKKADGFSEGQTVYVLNTYDSADLLSQYKCKDMDSMWRDPQGKNCQWFKDGDDETEPMCHDAATILQNGGSGEMEQLGSEIGGEKKSAVQACCACGGGFLQYKTRVSRLGNLDFTIINPVPNGLTPKQVTTGDKISVDVDFTSVKTGNKERKMFNMEDLQVSGNDWHALNKEGSNFGGLPKIDGRRLKPFDQTFDKIFDQWPLSWDVRKRFEANKNGGMVGALLQAKSTAPDSVPRELTISPYEVCEFPRGGGITRAATTAVKLGKPGQHCRQVGGEGLFTVQKSDFQYLQWASKH
jgi:hypothetical protein